MKQEYKLSFFVTGLTSLVLQVVMIREFIASFYGNEFFIGWLFFAWFLWTACGSLFANSRPGDLSRVRPVLAGVFGCVGVVSVAGIFMIAASRHAFGNAPGVIPDLVPALIDSFFSLGPLCFFLGMQFSLAGRCVLEDGQEGAEGRLLGKGYFWEALGFVAGGMVFSFLLVRVNVFYAVSFIVCLNGMMAVRLGCPAHSRCARIFLAVLLTGVICLITFAGKLDRGLAQLRFPSETLEETRNTIHGSIAVTRLGEQYNFYQNGTLSGTSVEDITSQLLVHLPMLASDSPRKVLIFGVGFNGPVQETLKHNPELVTCVDLDPELFRMAQKRLPPDLIKGLDEPAVQIAAADPREFLRSFFGTADVIIMNLPDPVSVFLNRNFTLEFFEQVRDRLAPRGVFAMRLNFSPQYISPELERLGSSLYATLHQVFPFVTVLPEETAYFLATREKTAIPEADEMGKRWIERNLQTVLLSPAMLKDRLTNDRVSQVKTIFENTLFKVKNTDLRPRACYFSLMRWLSLFHPEASKVLAGLSDISFATVVVLMVLFFYLPFAGGGTDFEKKYRKLACQAMAVTGFSIMAFEMVLIYLFQVIFGDLYFRIALLITAFMVGTGLGAFGGSFGKAGSSRRGLVFLSFLGLLFSGVMFFMFREISGTDAFLRLGSGIIFYLLAVVSGILGGFVFPVATRFYRGKGKGTGVGSVYAADLWGACAGAFLTATFLVPIWGLPRVMMLLLILNGVVLLRLIKTELVS